MGVFWGVRSGSVFLNSRIQFFLYGRIQSRVNSSWIRNPGFKCPQNCFSWNFLLCTFRQDSLIFNCLYLAEQRKNPRRGNTTFASLVFKLDRCLRHKSFLFSPERHFQLACATCSELPSNISSMITSRTLTKLIWRKKLSKFNFACELLSTFNSGDQKGIIYYSLHILVREAAKKSVFF